MAGSRLESSVSANAMLIYDLIFERTCDELDFSDDGPGRGSRSEDWDELGWVPDFFGLGFPMWIAVRVSGSSFQFLSMKSGLR